VNDEKLLAQAISDIESSEEANDAAVIDEPEKPPAVLALSSRPPTIDDWNDDSPTPHPLNYPCWTEANSFVVSGPLGDKRYPGRRMTGRNEARRYVTAKYGGYFEEIHIPGRWAFRVRRPQENAR
jgi:hypothetical protein